MVLLAAAVACGGKGKPAPPPGPAPGTAAVVGDGLATGAEPAVAPVEPPATPDEPRPNQLPEVFAPPFPAVGVGQTVSFGTAAIDQDLDDVKVEVLAMPASARFDAITQTITWKPAKAEAAKKVGKGSFKLKVTELARPDEAVEVTWDIPVTAKKVAPAVAPRASDAAETLFTIREPRRVEATAKALPFDLMLERGAMMMRPSLPPDVQAKLAAPDRAALFKSFLEGMAALHQNPRLDPDAKEFDAAAFGKPSDWKLVVVRPRIDKKFHELRLVYQAVKAPEPVFAMFRVRPVQDSPTLPPEARLENNKVFAELFWKHLLDADGAPNPKLVKDAKAHGKAVAAFVDAVLRYKGTAPWATPGFIALPTEARMGGGSKRAADGTYESGDGWAWSVMKPMVGADGTQQAYVNIGIPGFWTQAVASPDKKAWLPKCAPAFDPDDPKHTKGWEVLCRKALGFVDLPAQDSGTGGKVAPAKIDAVNLFRDHKLGPAQELLPLDDGRRDHGEENGMTCAQCHMRNFGVRDYADAATASPAAGVPAAGNRKLPTLNFQIIPTTTWEAYTLEFMQDQECKARAHLEAALGKVPALTCALADPAAPRVSAPLSPLTR